MTYGKRTLIAVDQLINTLLGGYPDETLSSRCYRWARDGVRMPQVPHAVKTAASARTVWGVAL